MGTICLWVSRGQGPFHVLLGVPAIYQPSLTITITTAQNWEVLGKFVEQMYMPAAYIWLDEEITRKLEGGQNGCTWNEKASQGSTAKHNLSDMETILSLSWRFPVCSGPLG